MNLKIWKTALLGGAAALAVGMAAPASAEDISTLRDQIEQMKDRLAKLEAERTEKRKVAAAAAVEAGDKPRSWKLPGTNTSMQIGGFIKMSVRYYLGSGGGPGGSHVEGGGSALFADVSQNDSIFNNGNIEFLARRSRIFFTTWTPTDWGELRTHIEGDFAGPAFSTASTNGNSGLVNTGSRGLRLRVAVGSLGPVTAGQVQTTFAGLVGVPEALDDGAPMAPGALRVPLVRYSHNFGGGLVLHVAAEAGNGIIDSGYPFRVAACPTVPATADCSAVSANAFFGTTGPAGALPAGGNFVFHGPDRWPDFVAALDYSFPGGRIYASGLVRQITLDNGGGSSGAAATRLTALNDSTIGWGASLAFKWDITPRFEIGGQGVVGEGIAGKFLSPPASFVSAIGVTPGGTSNAFDLRAVFSYGGVGYVQWRITDTMRVTGFGWYELADLLNELPGTKAQGKAAISGVNHYYYGAGANFLWNPVPQVTFGVEYIWQFASLYNSTNAFGSVVHLAAIYRF